MRFKSPVPGQYNFADSFKFGCKADSSMRFKTQKFQSVKFPRAGMHVII